MKIKIKECNLWSLELAGVRGLPGKKKSTFFSLELTFFFFKLVQYGMTATAIKENKKKRA
jgi:hypothetical protein